MKKMYIKPACEIENIINAVSILAASDAEGVGTQLDGGEGGPGFGGIGDASDNPSAKGETFWD